MYNYITVHNFISVPVCHYLFSSILKVHTIHKAFFPILCHNYSERDLVLYRNIFILTTRIPHSLALVLHPQQFQGDVLLFCGIDKPIGKEARNHMPYILCSW